MGEVHKLLTEHGKQVLLRSEVDRRVLDAAAAYMAATGSSITTNTYNFVGVQMAYSPAR